MPVSIAGHVKTLEDCEGDLASFGATSRPPTGPRPAWTTSTTAARA
ncbi:MAG: hypothetical protein ACLRIS_14750 [Flavonifractor plautii]